MHLFKTNLQKELLVSVSFLSRAAPFPISSSLVGTIYQDRHTVRNDSFAPVGRSLVFGAEH